MRLINSPSLATNPATLKLLNCFQQLEEITNQFPQQNQSSLPSPPPLILTNSPSLTTTISNHITQPLNSFKSISPSSTPTPSTTTIANTPPHTPRMYSRSQLLRVSPKTAAQVSPLQKYVPTCPALISRVTVRPTQPRNTRHYRNRHQPNSHNAEIQLSPPSYYDSQARQPTNNQFQQSTPLHLHQQITHNLQLIHALSLQLILQYQPHYHPPPIPNFNFPPPPTYLPLSQHFNHPPHPQHHYHHRHPSPDYPRIVTTPVPPLIPVHPGSDSPPLPSKDITSSPHHRYYIHHFKPRTQLYHNSHVIRPPSAPAPPFLWVKKVPLSSFASDRTIPSIFK